VTPREKTLLWILGGSVVLYLLARTDTGRTLVTDVLTSGSRGIRNNNPGNIRKSGTTWAGAVPPELQKDASFVIFTDAVYGIRAMAKILKSYAGRGLITIEKIISTWAPATENDTRAYIASVSRATGFDATKPLDTNQLMKLIPAIIQHENGSQPYPQHVIDKGVSLA